jgi:hypothetical protein
MLRLIEIHSVNERLRCAHHAPLSRRFGRWPVEFGNGGYPIPA